MPGSDFILVVDLNGAKTESCYETQNNHLFLGLVVRRRLIASERMLKMTKVVAMDK